MVVLFEHRFLLFVSFQIFVVLDFAALLINQLTKNTKYSVNQLGQVLVLVGSTSLCYFKLLDSFSPSVISFLFNFEVGK